MSKIADKKYFSCRYGQCDYQSTQFAQVLTHTWDKHRLDRNFKYICGISSCTGSYINIQSMLKPNILGFLTSIWSSSKMNLYVNVMGKNFCMGMGRRGNHTTLSNLAMEIVKWMMMIMMILNYTKILIVMMYHCWNVTRP